MSKHVEGIKGYFDLQHLQHTSTNISFDDMVKKLVVSAFQIFFWIENWLNIKKVISKNVMSPYSVFCVSFDTFEMWYMVKENEKQMRRDGMDGLPCRTH